MANVTPMQLGGIFALVLVFIGGGALLIVNHTSEPGSNKVRAGDVDRMFDMVAARGWKKLDGFSLLGGYEITGPAVLGQRWSVKYEMTKEPRFGGGQDYTSMAKLVPVTRWMSSGPRLDKGMLLVWPRPGSMPTDISGQPGAGMKIGNFDLGKMIVDTVIHHDYGSDGKQFADSEIMNLGTQDFKTSYAILSNNELLASQVLNEKVIKIMVEWNMKDLTTEPPQLLVWDKGVEISVFEKVSDFVVLAKLAGLGEAVVYTLSN